MDLAFGIAMVMGIGPALILMYLGVRNYTYPRVEQPFFSDPTFFMLLVVGMIAGSVLFFAMVALGFATNVVYMVIMAAIEAMAMVVVMNLKRFRGISETARGENIDLMDCYRRLAEKGLVEYDPNLVIRWSNAEDRSRKVGRSSVLMRTIVMNPALDSESVPEESLDYALYSQICHVNLGFGPTRENDAERYETMLSEYPERIQAEAELRRSGMNL